MKNKEKLGSNEASVCIRSRAHLDCTKLRLGCAKAHLGWAQKQVQMKKCHGGSKNGPPEAPAWSKLISLIWRFIIRGQRCRKNRTEFPKLLNHFRGVGAWPKASYIYCPYSFPRLGLNLNFNWPIPFEDFAS